VEVDRHDHRVHRRRPATIPAVPAAAFASALEHTERATAELLIGSPGDVHLGDAEPCRGEGRVHGWTDPFATVIGARITGLPMIVGPIVLAI
jgi:hypothetical protein